MDKKFETIYDEIPLPRVMDFYLKDYLGNENHKIVAREYYVDVTKSVVIFKLVIENQEPTEAVNA